MDGDSEAQTQRAHRKRQAGSKADKKKKQLPPDPTLNAKQRNPKAFAFQSINKVARQVRRTLDVQEKKHHIPVVDRAPAEPPPALVAVVGPPKVGKSTLVRCLVKNFTRQKVTNIKGPITVVSSKKKRLTIMECNNDINSMIDVAKVADLVLLMIDASFDYEMETLEFINICHVHGFPKIIGVLTHLDLFKDKKKLRKKKKTLKDRFWKEVYQGAKLFYLSGMINGEYQKTEVHNLGRFISVMKFRPLQWRSTHPYILVDRVEDVTDPDTLRKSPKTDRSVCLYGYVRGCHYRSHTHVHIPGCGDFAISDMSLLQDPCPFPDQIKKRTLNEKERFIYGPMSGVGGIVYDKDAIYIELGGSHSMKKHSASDGPLSGMVDAMLESKTTIDEKMADSKFQMFSNSAPAKTSLEATGDVESMSEGEEEEGEDEDSSVDEDEDDDGADNDSEDGSDSDGGEDVSDDDEPSVKRRRMVTSTATKSENDDEEVEEEEEEEEEDDAEDEDDDNDSNASGSDDGSDADGDIKWKTDLARKASDAFFQRLKANPNLANLVYNTNSGALETKSTEQSERTVGEVFRVVETSATDREGTNGLDCSLGSSTTTNTTLQWDVDKIVQSIKDCFVTGKWSDGDDAQKLLDDDDDLHGGFVDLETGESFGPRAKDKVGDDTDEGSDGSDDDSSADDDENGDVEKKEPTEETEETKETTAERRQRRMKEKLEKSKLRKKALFDSEYDDGGTGKGDGKNFYEEWKSEMEVQATLNRAEFDGLDDEVRVKYEGFRPGLYVRVQINNMPAEFVDNLDSTYPIILGGLLSAEQNVGYVTVRIKQHRWFKRKLKTNDPLIISLGWRRFQTVVVYSIQDHNGRHRYLKYTPDHLHCHATFWGPITPQTTGMLGIQTTSSGVPEFRISATGSVAELDKTMSIMKKLKFQGTPYKIYKNTAFIQGMFTTALEAAKFEGSLVQTVSKIRGQVKKAVREGPAGSFRATFEDKIQLSDIVFLKAWIPVTVPQFYNPVTSLLLPVGGKDAWSGMKTVGLLKRERGIQNTVNPDHLYHPIERRPRVFKPLIIPRDLQKALPFKDKPKVPKPVKDTVQSQRIAIIREPKERKVAQLMKMLKTLHEHKRKKERVLMRERAAEHQKKQAHIESNKAVKRKERAKHAFFLLGQSEKRQNKDAV